MPNVTLPSTLLQRQILALLLAGLAASLVTSSSSHHLRRHEYHEVRFLQEQCSENCCQQYVDQNCTNATSTTDEASGSISSIPFGVQILLMVILLLASALFSGLTLGILSLDVTGLEIIMGGDDERNSYYARRIYPLRKRGNLLLTTLLLGNVAVNSLLSILMADKVGGLVGFLASTFLIVVFGEILPQAICARHGLRIGSAVVPLVIVIVILFSPIAYPLAFMLDLMLGKELPTTYSKAEMEKLLQIHVMENKLDHDTALAMTGALTYKNIAVRQVMTPMDKVFMLEVNEKLNFETIARIFKSGYSRIPIYEVDKNNVIGLLFTKDLIFIDPEDETPLEYFIEIFGRATYAVWIDETLGDVLKELKKGRSHLALVRDVNNKDETKDPFYELKGIITLENIIEVIIGDQILDETDDVGDLDSSQSARNEHDEGVRWAKLRLLDAKIVDERLTHDEARAVSAHFSKNYSHVVSLLTDNQLHKLVAETPVTILPTAHQDVGQLLPNDLLYELGKPSDLCTLVMAGKVTVVVGADMFRSDVSSWAVLGVNALLDSTYKADFNAFVSGGPCRCIRISRARFSIAVDASAFERHLAHAAAAHDKQPVGSDPPIPAAVPTLQLTLSPVQQTNSVPVMQTMESNASSYSLVDDSQRDISQFNVNSSSLVDDGPRNRRHEKLLAAMQVVETPALSSRKLIPPIGPIISRHNSGEPVEPASENGANVNIPEVSEMQEIGGEPSVAAVLSASEKVSREDEELRYKQDS